VAREVNVFHSGWRATGTSVSVPQYESTYRLVWVDDAGVRHEASRLVRFPNVLSGIPARRLREYVDTILLNEARILAGIDPDQ